MRIVAISGDDPDDVRRFARDHHISYAIGGDNGATAGAYSVTVYPLVVVTDAAGIVRAVTSNNDDELAGAVTRLLP